MGEKMIYLAPWMGWVAITLLVVMEIFITYLAFRRDQLGLAGWLGATGLVVVVAIIFWLVSSGRLPAFVTRG